MTEACKEIAPLRVGNITQLSTNPYDKILELAIETKDLDKLKQFMDLKERHEANEARKAYHEAMAAFKANPPKILKDRRVLYKTDRGSVEYSHATLSSVTEKISSVLSIHGLSAAWKTEQSDGRVNVTCTITHVLGHSESTSLSASPDNSGSKNSIQAIGSTITYLERYTILAITGLATFEQDDDGNAAGGVKYIDDSQKSKLLDLLNSIYGDDHSMFLEHIGCNSVDDILSKDYKEHLAGLTVIYKKRHGKA